MIRRVEDIVDIPAEYDLEDVIQPNIEERKSAREGFQEIPTIIPSEVTVGHEMDTVQPSKNVEALKCTL
jgi:hypothetical protein